MSILSVIFNNSTPSSYILLLAEIIAIIVKSYFIVHLAKHQIKSNSKKIFALLSIIIISEILCDIAWAIRLARILIFPSIKFSIAVFINRLAWAFSFIEFFTLSLFLEYLARGSISIRTRHYFYFFLTVACTIYYLTISILDINVASNLNRSTLEILGMKFLHIFIFLVMIPAIRFTIKKMKSNDIPKLLKQQLYIFLWYLIIPKLLFDANPIVTFLPFLQPIIPQSNYTSVAISTLIMTYALYFCARKMMGLRFLNMHKHVHSSEKFNFIDDFKQTLENLGHVTNLSELRHITQHFFKDAFNIPLNKITLIIRPLDEGHDILNDARTKIIEQEISEAHSPITQFLAQEKIFITDEIEFNHFYESNTLNSKIVAFLKEVDADIFLPIYERNHIAAYIIIDRGARQKFYTMVERDEMLVFTSYLSNLIYLLRHKNLEVLLEREKTMAEELYFKHQEINQYKNSIRSFLYSSSDRKIGILFYKNRKFVYGNQAAQELISLDPNQTPGHAISQALQNITRKAQQFKTAQTITTKDPAGNRLVLSALPSIQEQQVIITVHYPEISDIIKDQLNTLKDPSDLDYVLYLETTSSGKLINELIPGTGTNLLQFKIDLLKMSLSKKALLITMPQEDLIPTVEIIHTISLRSNLVTLSLTAPEKNHSTAIKLFGLNPLFNVSDAQQPLLETLHENGSLFIENIHFLSMETQTALAEYLKYGYFKIFKSDRKIRSNVRIICSTTHNLEELTVKGLFSSALLQEIMPTTLTLPSLMTLNNEELLSLAQGFAEQTIQSAHTNHLVGLQEKDKQHLLRERPVSLSELKKMIHHVLKQKAIKHNLEEEISIDPVISTTDPQIIAIARLGKKALKDEKTMIFLWNKFKNQTKIATLLGVNRSSVNRRCKQFHIVE